MTPADIIKVSDVDFELQVIEYSKKTLVVVDFWAQWCIPCKTLDPILERLAHEAQGAFRLAKLNVDENQELTRRFQIRSIPVVKAFRDGRVVAEFSGVQPDDKIRAFLRNLVPSSSDLALEKAESLLVLKEWEAAESAYLEVLEDTPTKPKALLGLAKSFLGQGRASESLRILRDMPPSRAYAAAERLMPLAGALSQIENTNYYSDDPLEAAYYNALRLVAKGNIPAALDGLLDILRQDKKYRNGEAHKVILGIFELLGDQSNLTRQYRRELASVLF